MFKCEQCPSTFTRKGHLTDHQKNHDGVRFTCTVCALIFSYKCHLNRHMKNKHGVARDRPQRDAIEVASNIVEPDLSACPSNHAQNVNNRLDEYFNDGNDEMLARVLENYQDDTGVARVRPQRGEIEIAPNIIVPDLSAGPSNQAQYVNSVPNDDFNDGNEEMYAEVLDNARPRDAPDSYMTTEGNKRVHVENTTSRIKSKKARMDKANTSGFVEVKSAHKPFRSKHLNM